MLSNLNTPLSSLSDVPVHDQQTFQFEFTTDKSFMTLLEDQEDLDAVPV